LSVGERSKKRGGRRTPAGGRPKKRPEERAAARVTVRLYAADAELLTALCAALQKNEGEVMRHALRVLALAHGLESP
jgi:hypothetical protein